MIRADIPRKKYIRGFSDHSTPLKNDGRSISNIKFFEVNFFCYYKKGQVIKTLSIIKKNSLLVVAAATVIGFSAFKAVEKATMTEVWFTFNSPLNPSDGAQYEEAVLEPLNYTNTGSPTNPAECDDTQKVCAINAEPDANGNIPQATLDMHESDLLNPASTNPDISRKLND